MISSVEDESCRSEKYKNKAVEDSRLDYLPPYATHSSPPQPNSVVYSNAYDRRMSVSRRQRREGRS